MVPRSFLIRLLFFFVPVILGYLAIEYQTRTLQTPYIYNATILNREADQLEVMVLGSSQMHYGINANLLHQPTINLASGDQHHDSDFKLLKGLLPELKSLQTVVLEVSYSHFELPHNGPRFWKNSVYLNYYGVNAFERPVYFKDRLIYLANPAFYSEKLWEQYIGKTTAFGYNSRAFDTLKYDGLFKDLKYDEARIKPTRFKINTVPNREIFKQNTALFFEMLDFLKAHDIQVILAKAPMYKTYLPERHPGILKRRDSIIDLALDQYPEIRLLDRENDTIHFTVHDYWNQSHLNPDGAKKFTADLQGLLDSSGGI